MTARRGGTAPRSEIEAIKTHIIAYSLPRTTLEPAQGSLQREDCLPESETPVGFWEVNAVRVCVCVSRVSPQPPPRFDPRAPAACPAPYGPQA